MNKKIIGLMGAVVLLLMGIVLFFIVDNQSVFTGSRVKNPDSYTLEFTQMNQTDSHVISLSEGDALSVDFAIDRGRADLIIGIDGEKPIYTGNDIKSGTFFLNIPVAGQYRITVRAKHAAGYVSVLLSNDAGK